MNRHLRFACFLAFLFRTPKTEDYPHTHGSTLMECGHCGESLPGPWWAGRRWWMLTERKEFHAEWYWFRKKNRTLGVSLEIGSGDSEDGVQLTLHIPFLVSLYLSHEGFIQSRVRKIGDRYVNLCREWEMQYHFGSDFGAWGDFSWSFSTIPHEWSSDTPKWRHGRFDPADFVLGKQVHKLETLGEPTTHQIRLPDGVHELKIQHERRTWKRPRWPKALVKECFDVDCIAGCPIPGKGDNGWDCGDDAIYGTGFSVATAEEAAERFAQKVMEIRTQRESKNWMPREKVEA